MDALCLPLGRKGVKTVGLNDHFCHPTQQIRKHNSKVKLKGSKGHLVNTKQRKVNFSRTSDVLLF